MTKSYVSVEQHACMVCNRVFDTGAVLIDKRVKDSMEPHTVTGYGLCPEHKQLNDEGYIALVECDPTKSGNPGETLKPENAWRTGNVCHLRREVWARIFNLPPPSGPLVFVEPGVIDRMEELKRGVEGDQS